MLTTSQFETRVEAALLERNMLFQAFFEQESRRIADDSRHMAMRFQEGGRLLAFGRGAYSTDAQHVAVEFVHPVIVGKRALPALDLSAMFGPWVEAIVQPHDMVMGFGPPAGDPEIDSILETAHSRGAMTFALAHRTNIRNEFAHQEMIEILYHTLWETVHVFLERRSLADDAGASTFLYPFLGSRQQDTARLTDEVAASVRLKVAEDAGLRAEVAREQAEAISTAVAAIRQRVHRGGKLILFGNGGSATDANDFAIDCIAPPNGLRPIPAISLSMEPATITALANDVGTEVIFLRQVIAHACPGDVVVAISTSGGSRNLLLALEEARKRGLLTVGLLGYDGGEIARRRLVDHAIVVRSDYIPRIQEVQASVYHTIRELLE